MRASARRAALLRDFTSANQGTFSNLSAHVNEAMIHSSLRHFFAVPVMIGFALVVIRVVGSAADESYPTLLPLAQETQAYINGVADRGGTSEPQGIQPLLNRLSDAQRSLAPEVPRPIQCFDGLIRAWSLAQQGQRQPAREASQKAVDCYAGKETASHPETHHAGASHRDPCSPKYEGRFDEGVVQRKAAAIRLVEQGCSLYIQGNARGAANLWREAVVQYDDAVAQYRLGILYERGEGVQQDRMEAERLLGRASDQGMQPATEELVNLHPPIPAGPDTVHIPVCIGAAGANSADCERGGGQWKW